MDDAATAPGTRRISNRQGDGLQPAALGCTGRLRWADKTLKVSEVAQHLPFEPAREIEHQGHKVTQWIASTQVQLTRPAKPKACDGQGKRLRPVKGAPLPARLVVSQVRDGADNVLAQWYLLTNAAPTVDASTVALWYYWRWRIESYFKLLKEAGQQVEHWEQESGPALFKRLLLSAQACALAWRLMRAQGEFAERTRAFLVRLSGRQMKRSKPIIASALLAGLFMLLAFSETLEHCTPEEIAQFAKEVRSSPPPPGSRHV